MFGNGCDFKSCCSERNSRIKRLTGNNGFDNKRNNQDERKCSHQIQYVLFIHDYQPEVILTVSLYKLLIITYIVTA